MECSNHAYMLLSGGDDRAVPWAIPLASLYFVTDPEAVAELRSKGSLDSIRELGCPTYVEGFTLGLDRR